MIFFWCKWCYQTQLKICLKWNFFLQFSRHHQAQSESSDFLAYPVMGTNERFVRFFFCIWMQEAGRWKRVLSQNNNKLNSRYHGILLNCIYNCFYFSKSHYWSENILCMSFPTPFLAWFLSFSSLIFFILSSLQTGGLNIGSQACQASALSLSSVPSSLFIFSFEIGSPQMVHIDLELVL